MKQTAYTSLTLNVVKNYSGRFYDLASTNVTRNVNKAMGHLLRDLAGFSVGWSLSLESGGRLYDCAFGRNMASVSVKMFSYLVYFIKKFYEFVVFNNICKVNVVINYITVQHKNVNLRQLHGVILH